MPNSEEMSSHPPLPLPASYRRVVVVAAHPDDAEFSFGGTIARLTDEGAHVSYVVVTDGSQGGEVAGQPAEELVAVRCREQRDAAQILGVTDVTFLGFADGSLVASTGLRRALARQIRRLRPDLLLTHQPLRSLEFPIGASHPDHLAVGEAALSAVYPDARNPRAFPELLEEGLAPHTVAEVWVPGHEHADLLVDVGTTADRKLAAILAHRSQFASAADPRTDIQWVTDRMRGNGARLGRHLAEAFKRIVTGAPAGVGPTSSDGRRASAGSNGAPGRT
jgi:LmbE family N-acetylglucosaminyl deacetylase